MENQNQNQKNPPNVASSLPCPTDIRGQEIANFLGPSPQQVLYPGS